MGSLSFLFLPFLFLYEFAENANISGDLKSSSTYHLSCTLNVAICSNLLYCRMEFLCVENISVLAPSKTFAILQFLRSWFSLSYI